MSSALGIGRVAWAALRGLLLLLLIALFFWGLAAVLPGIDVPSFGAVLMITALVAVLNAVLWRRLAVIGPGATPAMGDRVLGYVALLLWLVIISAGRWIAYAG